MADSKAIFDPGWQARDGTGVLSGALIDFFLATTNTPDPVYSDADLTTSLGPTVTCDSSGFPTSDGSTRVMIWRGTASYRVRLRRADLTTVWDFNSQPGAVSTASSANRKYIGECFYYLGSTAPDTSCLIMNGKTLGSAASGATARASDSQDTASTYALLWNTFSNTVCPIEDSAGVASTRGATAAADFAANKRLPLLDACGRVLIGPNNMGGVASKNRLTGLSGGIDGDIPGATGGVESHTLTEPQLPVIDPDTYKSDPTHLHSYTQRTGSTVKDGSANNASANTDSAANTGSSSTGITFSNIGSGAAHNNVQPSIIVPLVLIYAGAP